MKVHPVFYFNYTMKMKQMLYFFIRLSQQHNSGVFADHIEKNHWLCNSLKIETKTTPNTKTTNIQAVISMVFRNNAWIRNDKS